MADGSEPMLRIRIAADYEAFPAWPDSPEARRLRIPDDLRLPPDLLADLWAWASVHDLARTSRTDFEWDQAVADERAWIEEGRALAARVQNHLGDEYAVLYPYE